MFCKMGNLDLQTRVPLMIRAPWLGAAAVGSTTALAEVGGSLRTIFFSTDMLPTAILAKSTMNLLTRARYTTTECLLRTAEC
jgi:hypothetical protein